MKQFEETKQTIRKGIQKVKQFKKSSVGKLTGTLLKNTALNVMRNTGYGQKLNDRLSYAVAPYTQGSVPLETLRKIIHASNHFYFQPQQSLGLPNYEKAGQQHTINLTRQTYEPAIKMKPARYIARRR